MASSYTWVLTIFIGLFLLDSGEASADPFENVRINYIRKRAKKENTKDIRELLSYWERGCVALGKALTGDAGPWGYGPFENYSCLYKGKGTGPKRGTFRVNIDDAPTGIRISVIQVGRGKLRNTVLGAINLPASNSFPFYLRDVEFVDLIALAISEFLPAAGKVNHTAKEDVVSVTPIRWGDVGKWKYQHPDPAQSVTFYTLQFEPTSGVWKGTVLGDSSLQAQSGNAGSYKIPQKVAEHKDGDRIYFHRSEGPAKSDIRFRKTLRAAARQLENALKTNTFEEFLRGAKDDLLRTLFSSAAAGYIGVRYGLQVLPSTGELGNLIGKTNLVSVLAEVRAGPLKGLRYYYDSVPEKEAPIILTDGTVDQQHMGFSRHVIGYSFGLELDSFIDRITIDPKLGMWRFEARFPAGYDAEGNVTSVEDFNLGRTFSFALEAGIESVADWYVLRGWAGADTGYSLLKTGGKVTSYRFGIDAFLSLGPEIPFFYDTRLKTTWILFYLFDRIEVKKNESPDLAVGESAITGLSYDAAFAGAGVALSW